MTSHRSENHPVLEKKRILATVLQRLVVGAIALWLIIAMTIMLYDVRLGMHEREILLDCTTPEGQCFKDSQKRTADVIDRLESTRELEHRKTRLVIIFAAHCAASYPNATVSVIKQCVESELNERIRR